MNMDRSIIINTFTDRKKDHRQNRINSISDGIRRLKKYSFKVEQNGFHMVRI